MWIQWRAECEWCRGGRHTEHTDVAHHGVKCREAGQVGVVPPIAVYIPAWALMFHHTEHTDMDPHLGRKAPP